jgi:hypothetical protein
VTRYGLVDRGSGFDSRQVQWKISFSSPPYPDRLWGPPALLSNGYRGLFFPGGDTAGTWSWLLISI